MHLLRLLFGLNDLYRVKKRGQYFVEFWWWGIAIWFTYNFLHKDAAVDNERLVWWSTAFLVVLAVFYGRRAVQSWFFNRTLRVHSKQSYESGRVERWHIDAAILQQYKTDTRNMLNYIGLQKDAQWSMYDILIEQKRRTKLGEYVAHQNVHTVFEARLQRVMPNIVFDNKRAHGRQFNSSYVASQRLSFEAGFNDTFDSYAPQSYQIDAFSFISPEVLHAMLDFTIPCDVEIIDDRLLCAAPLVSGDQLEAYKQQCENLYANLNDNLDTYRDDRLTGTERQVSTTVFARALLENPWSHWIALLVLSAIVAAQCVFAFLEGDSSLILSGISIYTVGPLVFEIGRVITIWYKNRKKMEHFQRMLLYAQSEDPRSKAPLSNRNF